MRPIRDLLKVWKIIRTTRNTKEKIMAIPKFKVGKGLLWSKTFWVNLLTGAASALGVVGAVPFLAPFAPYLVSGLAVVNIFLRLITNKPISGVK